MSSPQAKNVEGRNIFIPVSDISLIKTHNMSTPQAKNFVGITFFIPGSDIFFVKTHSMSLPQKKNFEGRNLFILIPPKNFTSFLSYKNISKFRLLRF